MDQKQTLELYQEILRGAQIGMGSIDELMKKSEDVLFREEMRRTREDYQYIAFEANERIHEIGGEPKPLSMFMRMNTWGMVSASTLFDTSNEHMSELMLKGIGMADKELSDFQERYVNADERAKDLADRLIQMEDAQRSVYRKYLN